MTNVKKLRLFLFTSLTKLVVFLAQRSCSEPVQEPCGSSLYHWGGWKYPLKLTLALSICEKCYGFFRENWNLSLWSLFSTTLVILLVLLTMVFKYIFPKSYLLLWYCTNIPFSCLDFWTGKMKLEQVQESNKASWFR